MIRKNLRVVAVAAGCAALLAVPVAAEEGPADEDGTVATFTLVSNGSLQVSVPSGDNDAPVDLGEATAGATGIVPDVFNTSNFGDVTVTDTRGALVAEWIATATGTDFDLDGGNDPDDPNQRVTAGDVLYTPGVPVLSLGLEVGLGTPVPGTLEDGALVAYAGSGNSTATWSPSMTFTLSPTQVAGTYRGTITHSVE